LPVVVLSHGNRLSRTDYDPLVRFLARNGFAVIQPDHPDASVDGLMISDGGGPDTWMIRAMQLRAVAENIEVIASHSSLLAARMDPDRMVVIGHSYGGHSAALAMGARPAISSADFAVTQFRAAILLAPPGDFDGMTEEWRKRAPYLDVDYGAMRGPMLIINGGIDDSVMTTQGPRWHDVPFTRGPTGQGICLMTVEGAGHYLGGIDSFLRPPGDASTGRRDLVFSAIRSFLDKALDLSAPELSDTLPIRCR
jgi:predicted dienelactone hydrolase